MTSQVLAEFEQQEKALPSVGVLRVHLREAVVIYPANFGLTEPAHAGGRCGLLPTEASGEGSRSITAGCGPQGQAHHSSDSPAQQGGSL